MRASSSAYFPLSAGPAMSAVGTKRTSDAQPFAYAINGTARHYPKLRSPVADHAAALAIVGMDRLSFQYPRLAVGRRHGRHNGQRHLRTGPTCPLMRACPNSTAAVIPMPAREAWAGLLRGDVRAGEIAMRSGNPDGSDPWCWRCGFYPGSGPGAPLGRRRRSNRPRERPFADPETARVSPICWELAFIL